MRFVWMTLVLAGCVHDSLERCGDLLCPDSAVCMQDRCVPQAALDACANRPDGSECTTSQLTGVCKSGECIAAGCGNGVVEGKEVCDGGEACASDCGAIIGCPPPGMEPVYSRTVAQLFVQSCSAITVSTVASLAVGSCSTATTPTSISVGSLYGGPLVPVAIFTNGGSVSYSTPRLVPEGDAIWVQKTNGSIEQLVSVSQSAPADWTVERLVMPFPYYSFGTPSAGPTRRLMVTDAASQTIRELEIGQDNNVIQKDGYTPFDLGLTSVGLAPNLSADGLHLTLMKVFGTGTGLAYSDRASLDDHFGPVKQLIDLTDTVMSASPDCQLVTVTGLGSVFYVRQIGWN